MIKRLFFLICMVFIMANTARAEIEVHFLDVGQGDCAIIICDGEAMIIDGGPVSASQYVYSYIRNTLGLDNISLMVATHPHDDHIGGLSAVLNAVPVNLILSPVTEHSSIPFSFILKYADQQGTPIIVPSDGDEYQLGSSTITILLCYPEAWTENDMSIVLRIDYGDNSFLFTGDAQSLAEYMLLDSQLPLQADVLKVGHHGSKTSSTLEFLQAVSPSYAIISCGKNNSYGHPHQVTIDALNAMNVCILRTDICGKIICRGDGKTLRFELEYGDISDYHTEKGEAINEEPVKFIGDMKTKTVHKETCVMVYSLFLTNSDIEFNTFEDALENGYHPCEKCFGGQDNN